MSAIFTLHKGDRLKSKVIIDKLFKEGKTLFAHPIKLIYLPIAPDPGSKPLLFGVSVPKRLHKKAVDRNLLKRRIREAYRVERIDLQKKIGKLETGYALMYIYVIPEIESFDVIKKAILRLNRKLIDIII